MIALAVVNTVSWVPTIQQPVSEFAIKLFPQIPKDTNWLAIVSALLFLGFVIWTLWDLSRKLEESENKKPFIVVEPTPDINYHWCLNVTNNGEEGNFETQISLLAVCLNGDWFSTEEFFPWKGIWESTSTNEIKIKQGHSESVKLALIKGTVLGLIAYDLKTKSEIIVKEFSSDSSPKGKDTTIRIRVIISSNPSPRNGTFEKIYEITPFDMIEVKQPKFREMSVAWDSSKRKRVLLRYSLLVMAISSLYSKLSEFMSSTSISLNKHEFSRLLNLNSRFLR